MKGKAIAGTILFLFLASLGMSSIKKVPLIPVEDFFKNSEKTGFKLSPDGNYFSFLKPWKKRMNVYVQKIGESTVTRITGSEKRDISGYFWANDKRIVYVQDKGGDENFKVYGVNIDGSNPKELTPFDKVKVNIIDDLENDSEHMLISMNKRDSRIFDVYKLNINSGKLVMVAKNPGNISGWMTDHKGEVRVAITTDGVNSNLLYREKQTAPFKVILKTTFKESINPLFFTPDNKYLYVSSNLKRDKSAIFKYDIANGKFLEKIFEHPEVDVSSLLYSDKQKKILGVSYYTDKRHYKFFDKAREELQKKLEAKLPGVEVAITSSSKDESKMLVRTYSDKTRGAYYFYDKSAKKLEKIVEISPWLKASNMAPMTPVKYKSRDGFTINGYLTLPIGIKAKNLPVVINPHGGPWARDYWGYNPEIQLLANRGYAVLQMNFRGSTGYGRKFWEASFKKWGKEMQNDITDGVRWLIKKGIADPKRVAIYGASYGGYATLAGVTFTPDLYKCAIDYVGVSNLFTFMKSIPPYWKPYLEMLYEMVGHPEKDKELLRAGSPIFHVDKIKAPLFVAQGANDPRVVKSESDQIVNALRKRGISVEYMVKDNEGHGFRNEENRFDFYRAVTKFLNKHMK